MKLKINQSELDIIRSNIQDLPIRASAILIMHQLRVWDNPRLLWLREFCTSAPLRAATTALRDLEVILVDKHYKAGEYASNLIYADCSNPIESDLIPEYPYIEKILQFRKNKEIKEIAKIQNINGIHYDDVSYFDVELVEINQNIKKLSKELKLFEENTKNYNKTQKDIKKLKYQQQSIEDFIKNKIQIYSYKKYNCKRLFSSITNLPSALKSHLCNDNGYFFGIDIKASQPRLVKTALLTILNENNNHVTIADLWFYTKWILDVDQDLCSIYGIDEYHESYEDWIRSIKIELNGFNEIVKDDMYYYVVDAMKLEHNTINRNNIKKEFLYYMFDFNNKLHASNYTFKEFMEIHFPLLNTFIIGLKKAQKYSKSKKYSLSNCLCSVESNLILKTISKAFIKKHPNTNIFTIHDSIAVNVEYINDLIEILKQTYLDNDIHLNYTIEDYKNNKKYNNINNIINDNNNNINNIKQYNNNIKKAGGVGGREADLCLHFSNDTKINDTKIREVKDHGSIAWMYRGTGDQQIKKSTKKYTKEQFIKLINAKFMSGEWK